MNDAWRTLLRLRAVAVMRLPLLHLRQPQQYGVPQEDMIKLADRHPAMTACSPPAPERAEVSTETLRKRRWKRDREPSAVHA